MSILNALNIAYVLVVPLVRNVPPPLSSVRDREPQIGGLSSVGVVSQGLWAHCLHKPNGLRAPRSSPCSRVYEEKSTEMHNHEYALWLEEEWER